MALLICADLPFVSLTVGIGLTDERRDISVLVFVETRRCALERLATSRSRPLAQLLLRLVDEDFAALPGRLVTCGHEQLSPLGHEESSLRAVPCCVGRDLLVMITILLLDHVNDTGTFNSWIVLFDQEPRKDIEPTLA